MRYQRVQFRDRVVISKTPFTSVSEVESLEVVGLPHELAYLIEDDGDNHVRITKATGGLSARVPWSNIAAAVSAPIAVAAEPEPAAALESAIHLDPPKPTKARTMKGKW